MADRSAEILTAGAQHTPGSSLDYSLPFDALEIVRVAESESQLASGGFSPRPYLVFTCMVPHLWANPWHDLVSILV